MIILRGKYIDRSKEEVRGGEQCYPTWAKFHWLWMVLCNEGMSRLPTVFFVVVVVVFVFHEYHFCFSTVLTLPITVNNYKKVWVLLEKKCFKSCFLICIIPLQTNAKPLGNDFCHSSPLLTSIKWHPLFSAPQNRQQIMPPNHRSLCPTPLRDSVACSQ